MNRASPFEVTIPRPARSRAGRITSVFPGLLDPEPPGGSPVGDIFFMRWVERFALETNVSLGLIYGRDEDGKDIGPRLRGWQLMGHLLRWCLGLPKGQKAPRMQPRQRLRFLSIQWTHRRAEFMAEADRYVEKLQHIHETGTE